MATWEAVRGALKGILETRPEALTGSPTLESDPAPEPPYAIALQPWAAEIAAQLHSQFGPSVALRVGALPFPVTGDSGAPVPTRPESIPAERAGIDITLEHPLVMPAGHTGKGAVLIRNGSDRALAVDTSGALTAWVIDPSTSEVVGGYAGWQTQPLVTFSAGTDETVRIPLLVGTASLVPALGYAVPPGEWAVSADLRLADARVLRTPNLPITVIGEPRNTS